MGGYRVSPDELAAQVQHWERILARLGRVKEHFERASRHAISPTLDPRATDQAKMAKEYADREVKRADARSKYLRGQINKAKKALGTYVEQEEVTAASYKTQDTDGGGSNRNGTEGLTG